jgi:hypothetical protein
MVINKYKINIYNLLFKLSIIYCLRKEANTKREAIRAYFPIIVLSAFLTLLLIIYNKEYNEKINGYNKKNNIIIGMSLLIVGCVYT